MLPQTPGTAAWGLMTGVAMVKTGMSPVEAIAMTLLVYAGSAQLAAVPLIIAGAPLWVILATAFCVNLRFVVFSLHMRDHLMHLSLVQRLWLGYINTDVNYVLFVRRYPKPAQTPEQRLESEAWLAGNCGITWVVWISASLLGIAMTHLIPTTWGLGFAGILCLLAVLCALVSNGLRAITALGAGVVAVLAYTVPLRLNIVLAIVVTVTLSLLLEQARALLPQREGAP